MVPVPPEDGPDITNYWQSFQLHRDPFAMIADKELVYMPNQWEEILDLLQYICHYKNQLMLVAGDNGAGKTTLIDLLLSQMGETVHVGRLSAESSFDVSRLIELISDVFNVPWRSEQPLEQMLDEELTSLQQKDRPCLLVIDNAHVLPFETLEALLYLIGQQSEHQMNFHVLLVAEPGLLQVMQRLLDPEEESLVHTINLSALTMDETSLYLGHRLAVAGWQEDFPLTDEIITRIYRLSEGNPARINRIARRVLLDMLTQDRQDKTRGFIKRYANKLIGCGALLVVLIIAASWLVHNAQTTTHGTTTTSISLNGQALSPEAPADGSIPLPLPQALKSPSATPDSTPTPTSTEMAPASESTAITPATPPTPTTVNPNLDSTPVTTPIAPVSKEAIPVAAPIIVSANEESHSTLPAISTAKATVASAPISPIVAPVTSVPSVAVSTSPSIATTADTAVAATMPAAENDQDHQLVKTAAPVSVVHAAKVKTNAVAKAKVKAKAEVVTETRPVKAPEAYGLELLGVTSAANVSQLLKQYPDLKAHLTIVRGASGSLKAYYGHYPSLKAATQALVTVPNSLAQQKLWPSKVIVVTKKAKLKKTVVAVKAAT